jgi:hypothetical protein
MGAEQYDLEERLLQYAARIIRLAEQVTRSPAGQHVALQVMRSGTAPLASHAEAHRGSWDQRSSATAFSRAHSAPRGRRSW